MAVTFAIALALAAAGTPAPAPEPGAPSDSQIIVVEVPDAALTTPTGAPTGGPTGSPTPSSSVRPSPSATPDGSLPATGWDAAGLAAVVVLGSGALAAGILLSRSRRRAG